MSSANETARILNAEAEDQLVKAREEVIAKLLKQRLVLQELKRMRVEDLDLIGERDQLKQALNILKADDYLALNQAGNEHLLNLGSSRSSVNLSYTETKAVRDHLNKSLRENLKPIAALGQKMRQECPELFTKVSSTSYASTTTSAPVLEGAGNAQPLSVQLLNLEILRRKMLQELADIESKKCELLKTVAELKMGPCLGNELELLHSQVRLNQTKANVLSGVMVNNLLTRTDHSLEAVKEVEGYIDRELERIDE